MKLFHTLFFALVLLFSTAAISAATEKININTANAAQIASSMTGIGDSKAEAIVLYRKNNGNFKSLADLENVDGVGAKTVEKNKDRIML